MRDSLKTPEYWKTRIENNNVIIERQKQRLLDLDRPYDKRLMSSYDLTQRYYIKVSALYSAGESIEKVAEVGRVLLTEIYPQFITICREHPSIATRDYSGGWDFYYRCFAIAVLCKLEPSESDTFIDAMDFWPERDRGWEYIIAYLGRNSERPEIRTLLWPEAYKALAEALDQKHPVVVREKWLSEFHENWLAEMRRAGNPMYSNHDSPHDRYFGYWAFETAAAAIVSGVDDSLLCTQPYYPGDWAAWTRSRQVTS